MRRIPSSGYFLCAAAFAASLLIPMNGVSQTTTNQTLPKKTTTTTAPAPKAESAPRPSAAPAPAPRAESPRPTYTPPAPSAESPRPEAPRPAAPAAAPAPRAEPPRPAYTPPAPARTETPRPATAPVSAGPRAVSPRPAPAAPASRPSPSRGAVYSVPPSAVKSNPTGGATALNHDGSRAVVSQLNTARAGLKGINARPLPAGDVTVHPNGGVVVRASSGRQFELRPNGTLASFSGHGESASFRSDGHVAVVHSAKVDIRHNINGARVVVSHPSDKSLLVGTGARSGYLERTVVVGNRPMVQRTYVVNRVTYSRVYSRYNFHGVVLEHYVPRVYYAPAFYGWAYSERVNKSETQFGIV